MPNLDMPAEVLDLDLEARVTAFDRALSPRFWAKYATPLLKRMLDAVRE